MASTSKESSPSELITDSSISIEPPPISMLTSSPLMHERLDIAHGRGGSPLSSLVISSVDVDGSENLSNSSQASTIVESQHDLDFETSDKLSPVSKKIKLSSPKEECPFFKQIVPSDCSFELEQRIDSINESFAGGDSMISLQNGNEAISNDSFVDHPLEFDILDADSGDSTDDGNSSDATSNTESEFEIHPDEIDAMLEDALKQDKNKDNSIPFEEKEKIVLKVRGRNHFDVLPEGWLEVSHNSGMPIYLNKLTRVCSLTKPYFLGSGSVRKHEIPISAIPCLHYSKELEKEKQAILNSNGQADKDNEQRSIVIPNAKVESIEDNKKECSLDPAAVREYCQKRFEFETITVKRFKTWCSRRNYMKRMKLKQRPSLPENTKLITCSIAEKGQPVGNANPKREFIMNPSGKSAVCILHEYVQHTLKVQPRYVFKELENAATPYGAVVMIDGMEYGFGYGSSKKQAKSEAAKASLEILIPNVGLFDSEKRGKNNTYQDVDFFDQVRVEDPRVCDLCVKAGQPYPYQILLECLKRNYGMGDTDVHIEMKNLKHQKNEFTMKVGKHTISVICKNKRDGKQLASQSILQKLHPQIASWGSLLRMYGVGSRQTLKEKKVEEQRITELQSKACANRPNTSILNKLKKEMMKYRKKREAVKPIGKLIPEKLDFLPISDSNLKNVEL